MLNVNYENIKKLLKRPVGYVLFTISNGNSFQKIAARKKLLKKDEYSLVFSSNLGGDIVKFDKKMNISQDGILTIDGVAFKIEDARYVLRNPKKEIESDNRVYRSIDATARNEEKQVAAAEKQAIIEEKDRILEETVQQAKEEKDKIEWNHTGRKIQELREQNYGLVFGEVICDSYSAVWGNNYLGHWGCNQTSSTHTRKDGHGINFVITQLESISSRMRSKAFKGNRLSELSSKIMELFDKLKETGYDEKTIGNIYYLRGLLVEELTLRIFDLCNHIRVNDIDTSKLHYSKRIYTNNYNVYEDEHRYSEDEVIHDYFNSIIDGACEYIKRVTGQDIKSEVEVRLQKQEIVIPFQLVRK